mmetsp:Transcript_13686/g.16109  ORF Transcript_13686/g.16109 Transcript_13686/m.16109 type:complete len:111 (+) Transcript_13686:324-656(+)
MVSSLQGDLNEEIKMANVRRRADAEAAKVAISKMEEDVDQRFDGNDIILKSLHQGQMLTESNLKIIMEKMGVPMVLVPVASKTNTRKMRVLRQQRIGLKATGEEGVMRWV